MVATLLQPIRNVVDMYKGKKTDQIEAHLDFVTLQLAISSLLQVK